MAEKVLLLEKAKKALSTKESVLKNKKDELDKIITATEKEERHFAKLSAEAREKIEPRLLHSYDRIRDELPQRSGCSAGRARCPAEVVLMPSLTRDKVKSVSIRKLLFVRIADGSWSTTN